MDFEKQEAILRYHGKIIFLKFIPSGTLVVFSAWRSVAIVWDELRLLSVELRV